MLRPPLVLQLLPQEELIEDLELLLHHDQQLLEMECRKYDRLAALPDSDARMLDRFLERLEHAHNRFDFFQEALCRLQLYDNRMVLGALEQARQEARKHGTPNRYGFSIFFEGFVPPIILIY